MVCFYFRSKQIFFSQTSIDFKLALSAFIRVAERSTGETSHSLSEVKMGSGGRVHLVLRTSTKVYKVGIKCGTAICTGRAV